MLIELHIKNFGILENLYIEFSNGLNILTGETGTGKSILIGAVSLLLGERASTDSIRTGADKSQVEGLFDLTDSPKTNILLEELDLISEDNTLLIKRILNREGKNRCYVNDQTVTLGTLKIIGDSLVDLHGQHQHQVLLNTDKHIEFLDDYGKLEIDKRIFADTYKNFQLLKREIKNLIKDIEKVKTQKEFYEFQLKEIDTLSPKPDEDEELMQELSILEHYEKLFNTTHNIYYELSAKDKDINSQIKKMLENLKELENIDERLKIASEYSESALIALEELAHTLRDYSNNIIFNPERAEAVRSRLFALRQLIKKYGGSMDALIEKQKKLRDKLSLLDANDNQIENKQKELEEFRLTLSEQALNLSQKRKIIAKEFSNQLAKELKELGMSSIIFDVRIEHILSNSGEVIINDKFAEVNEQGIDHIEFLISPNPGEELKPLAKIASGGEISRIMLAMKKLLGQVDQVNILIFGEIDTGIGGRIANVVGKKLMEIAKQRQVLCITHLHQIAARGDNHYQVSKFTEDGRTFTRIIKLEGEERIQEIARMLGGETLTGITLQHARELLEKYSD